LGAGAALLAVAGLVRETSILAATALVPKSDTPHRWMRALGALALCCAPIVIWTAVLSFRHDPPTGQRNFAMPFVALVDKVRSIVALWRSDGFSVGVRGEVCAVIALLTNVGFMLLRPKPANPWWRLGTPFALLVLVLGGAVWEGAPSAATRAVLPLTLAFNVLVPRGSRGLGLLIAGNLTVLSATTILQAPASEQTLFARGVTCNYVGWHPEERLDGRSWRWAGPAPAFVILHNPTREYLSVTLVFQLSSVVDRIVAIDAPGRADVVALRGGQRVAVRVGPFALAPGDTDVTFDSKEPPWIEPVASGRSLTFNVQDLYAVVTLPAR
jgi:hypothetical protein